MDLFETGTAEAVIPMDIMPAEEVATDVMESEGFRAEVRDTLDMLISQFMASEGENKVIMEEEIEEMYQTFQSLKD